MRGARSQPRARPQSETARPRDARATRDGRAMRRAGRTGVDEGNRLTVCRINRQCRRGVARTCTAGRRLAGRPASASPRHLGFGHTPRWHAISHSAAHLRHAPFIHAHASTTRGLPHSCTAARRLCGATRSLNCAADPLRVKDSMSCPPPKELPVPGRLGGARSRLSAVDGRAGAVDGRAGAVDGRAGGQPRP
jgi:hypothetical protein